MARIRSIHPGIHTDEAYAALSHGAWRLAIGIWNECDDQGVFEWKPITLKMRLLPAHNDDVAALLAELEAGNIVRRLEHDGREYGAVRNFRKYQKPKKPTTTYILPPEFRTYVGIKASSSEPGPASSAPSSELDPPLTPPSSELSDVKEPPVLQNGEIGLLMEEGGGKREGSRRTEPNGSGGDPPSTSKFIYDLGKQLLARGGMDGNRAGGVIRKWLREHGEDRVLLALKACDAKRTPDPVPYVESVLRDRAGERRGAEQDADDAAVLRGVV